jgi:3-(3-hydroxy-phenyl)propionate hydroxylase
MHNNYFHQPDLEEALRAGVTRFREVQVHYRHDVYALTQLAERVQLQMEDLASGMLREVEASWVVGCDGARSLVRRVMGSSYEDLGMHQPWLVIDMILRREVDLPGYTIQHCDSRRPMTACYVIGKRRRWEIMLMPGDDPRKVVKSEYVWESLSRWIGPQDAEIERAAVYTFHSVIARGWRRRRLLIAGDAAHQTPPFLGQGMCAGIRDASNLAWKLAMVVRARAPESLLDTYETERRPHIRAFIDLAVRLGGVIQTTDPQAAAERDPGVEDGTPQLFSFPSPALGAGAHSGGPIPVATVFAQPRLADGRLLDEALGVRFAVIGARELLEGAAPETRRRWQALDVATLPDPGGELEAWLQRQGARAVVLRPDRYVFGLAANQAELERLSGLLPLAGEAA